MTEATRQYVSRLLGYLGRKNALTILSASPRKIQSLVAQRNRSIVYRRPAPGKWSVAEIVAHLAETELVMGWRYRSIAERSGVKIQPFDQDIWEKNAGYSRMKIDESLALFTLLRKMNIAFLKGLSRKKLRHYGLHAERGKETILHIMSLEAGHDINHIMQIERIVLNRS